MAFARKLVSVWLEGLGFGFANFKLGLLEVFLPFALLFSA